MATTRRSRWPEPTTDPPSFEDLMDWECDEDGCEATDGCWVEPDGVCPHGHPSWMIVMGVI
jgi:hypothetical protein